MQDFVAAEAVVAAVDCVAAEAVVKQVLDLFHEYEYYYDFQNIPALQMSLNGPMI